MIRTCVGCRQKAYRNELLRVVADSEGCVQPDPHATMPGRGAWIHPRSECIAQAIKTSQFARAFRRPVRVSDELEPSASNFVRSARFRANNPMKAGREPMGTR
ncbi:YlxR family protein [Arcanobacterium phocisimile]|uniref:YlxR family protein n=2 Tax=Arcanobacterium phocisimile TaxID=1302235 RepID=A0ABX7ILL9_9ACTO|nr:YlxR family protein [Arcanobacterium phocisimile]